jgi:hypothetical protein
LIILLFLTATNTAMDTDAAMNTVRIINNDGNSGVIGIGGNDAEVVGAAVGDDDEDELEDDELTGAEVGDGVGLGAKVAEMVVAPLTF